MDPCTYQNTRIAWATENIVAKLVAERYPRGRALFNARFRAAVDGLRAPLLLFGVMCIATTGAPPPASIALQVHCLSTTTRGGRIDAAAAKGKPPRKNTRQRISNYATSTYLTTVRPSDRPTDRHINPQSTPSIHQQQEYVAGRQAPALAHCGTQHRHT